LVYVRADICSDFLNSTLRYKNMPLNCHHDKKSLNILVLADKSPGHANQAIGVAEALGRPFQIWNLEYNWLATLPNRLLGATKYSVKRPSEEIALFRPDLIISCGRRTAPLARYFKKKYGNATTLVHIMNPEAGYADFKAIVMPIHDDAKHRNNFFYIQTSPHTLTAKTLDDAKTRWREIIPKPQKVLGVLVGGGIKGMKYTHQEMTDFANLLAEFAITHNVFLFITTSPRTGSDNSAILQNTLQNKLPSTGYYLHMFASNTENPYHGILAISDFLLVTGDSVSMVSEALFTGKTVYVYDKFSCVNGKHKKFLKSLHDNSIIQVFGMPLTQSTGRVVNSSQEIADFINDFY